MGLHMTDFKLSFRGQRRRSGGRGPTSPLDEIAAQIAELDADAQRASQRINQSARKLRSSHRWHPESADDMLADLADTLVARADAIRAECDQLAALLERARTAIEPAAGETSAGPSALDEPETVEHEPEAVPAGLAADMLDGEIAAQLEGSAWDGPVANGRDGSPPASEGVRLIATQMAIAGSTRAEIKARLRDQFGIADVQPVLEEIFGQPSPGARG